MLMVVYIVYRGFLTLFVEFPFPLCKIHQEVRGMSIFEYALLVWRYTELMGNLQGWCITPYREYGIITKTPPANLRK